jgi:hypothetical protein
MPERIITFYCLLDDLLQAIGYTDDSQAAVTTAEIMTIALVAADLFGGCFELSHAFLHEHGYLTRRLSKRRFNRRLHAVPEGIWRLLSSVLAARADDLRSTGNPGWLPASCTWIFSCAPA